jgi:glycosyltransferase involved in cell wall biosynthesis
MILSGLRAAGNTGHIACVSEATRRDVLRVTKVLQDNVSQIYNGLNFPYAPLDSAQARARIEKFGIQPNRRFILHVGGNNWYKNRLGVLKIFSVLKSRREGSDLLLVMAGQRMTSKMRRFLRHSSSALNVIELVNPSNEDLRALYSCADLLLFPSIQEGFGWPIIEAQACGCPVVTSDRAAMTEVGGTAATYINPDDIESAAATIASRLRKRNGPCEASLKNAERFSASEMIDRYLALHQNLLRVGNSNGHCYREN